MLHSLLFFYLGQFEVVIWINRENVKIVFLKKSILKN
jgi:hypothetical protein